MQTIIEIGRYEIHGVVLELYERVQRISWRGFEKTVHTMNMELLCEDNSIRIGTCPPEILDTVEIGDLILLRATVEKTFKGASAKCYFKRPKARIVARGEKGKARDLRAAEKESIFRQRELEKKDEISC